MPGHQIKLNLHANSAGVHPEAWRPPFGARQGEFGISYYQEIAREAERGLFDAIFFADTVGLYDGRRKKPVLDPTIIVTAIAAVTERIGLVASASTTFSEPYNVARLFSTLDHVSAGRAGWNVVTTYNENAARNFGLPELPEKADRYRRAEEFVDVVRALWESWDYEAVEPSLPLGNKPGRVPTPINHAGRFFQVAGPLQLPRTPQGSPVVFQAGGSEEGRALAARTAEGVFTSALALDEAQEFYRDVKGRLAAFGRNPQDLLILPGIYVYLGSTEAEAKRIGAELRTAVNPVDALKELARQLSTEPDRLEFDRAVPEPVLAEALVKTKRSTTSGLVALARQEGMTVRRLLDVQPIGVGLHRVLVGTPEQVAGSLEEWFLAGAADGFNIGNLSLEQLGNFVDTVIPVLQAKGLFRRNYSGRTLRAHYRQEG